TAQAVHFVQGGVAQEDHLRVGEERADAAGRVPGRVDDAQAAQAIEGFAGLHRHLDFDVVEDDLGPASAAASGEDPAVPAWGRLALPALPPEEVFIPCWLAL